MCSTTAFRGVSFDLFGTLVTVPSPENPARAVAAELGARGVPVPEDWEAAYVESHVDVPAGGEVSLPDHVAAAVASRAESVGRREIRATVEDAVLAAFDAPVRSQEGAARAVDALAGRVPLGVLSNCSVPTLAERSLAAADVDETAFDATVTSVDCGWRKPDPRAFEATADELGVDLDGLLHVGDDPRTDGGAENAGATSLLLGDGTALDDVPNALEEPWE
jgi:HAD superfamily hydrolase (TIGR01549 family)